MSTTLEEVAELARHLCQEFHLDPGRVRVESHRDGEPEEAISIDHHLLWRAEEDDTGVAPIIGRTFRRGVWIVEVAVPSPGGRYEPPGVDVVEAGRHYHHLGALRQVFERVLLEELWQAIGQLELEETNERADSPDAEAPGR